MKEQFPMLHPTELARLVCRPALLKDTADMLEVTRHIWDGHDYVPETWAEWLDDPEGFLAVAEYGGRVVGICMLECFSPHEWYLAGLRVHPEMEDKGIASHLHAYMLDYWQHRHGQGIIRLATMNPKVKHLCDRTGFHQIGEFTIFTATCLAEAVDTFTPLTVDQAETAFQQAVKSPIFTWQSSMYGHDWWWSDPQLKYIIKAIQEGRAWQWRGDAGLLVTVDDEDEGTKYPTPEIIGCSPADLSALLLDYRRLAAKREYPYVGWITSLHPELQPYLAAAGFKRAWDKEVLVYERK